MRFHSTPIHISSLYAQFSHYKKNTLMRMVKDAFVWKKSSFYKKQVHIYEKINECSEIIGELLEEKTYTSLSKHLFEYKLGEQKEGIPSHKDILWTLEIVTQIHNFVKDNNSPIANHFILWTMDSTFFSGKNTISANFLLQECKIHLERYSELLLVQSKHLEKLLTKTKLYYPSLPKETVLLGIGATIRFASKVGGFLEKDEEWEQDFRVEGTALDPGNLHFCAMLDEEEIISFVEESESTEASQLMNTIIKQLTLEEFYRTENENNFARISNIVSFLPRTLYSNLSDPVRKLYTFTEYIYNKYKFISLLPISVQSELLHCSISERSIQDSEDIDSIFSQIDTVAQIIFYLNKEEQISIREQEKVIKKYCSIIQTSNKFPLSDIVSLTKELYDTKTDTLSTNYCSLLLSLSLEESLLVLQYRNFSKTLILSQKEAYTDLSTQKHYIISMLIMEASKPFSDLYKDNILFLVKQYISNNKHKGSSIPKILSFIEMISLSCSKILSLEKKSFANKIEESCFPNTFSTLESIQKLLFSLNTLSKAYLTEDFSKNIEILDESVLNNTDDTFPPYLHHSEQHNQEVQEVPPIQ